MCLWRFSVFEEVLCLRGFVCLFSEVLFVGEVFTVLEFLFVELFLWWLFVLHKETWVYF